MWFTAKDKYKGISLTYTFLHLGLVWEEEEEEDDDEKEDEEVEEEEVGRRQKRGQRQFVFEDQQGAYF